MRGQVFTLEVASFTALAFTGFNSLLAQEYRNDNTHKPAARPKSPGPGSINAARPSAIKSQPAISAARCLSHNGRGGGVLTLPSMSSPYLILGNAL